MKSGSSSEHYLRPHFKNWTVTLAIFNGGSADRITTYLLGIHFSAIFLIASAMFTTE